MKVINALVLSIIALKSIKLQCCAFCIQKSELISFRNNRRVRPKTSVPMSFYSKHDVRLPDILDLKDSIIVVKYGGNAMTSPELAEMFCEDVAELQTLGAKMIVVHGGSPHINAMLSVVDVETHFNESGMRISTPEVVNIAEMVLCGSVNKLLANNICNAGGNAIGLSGRDNQIMQCVQSGNREELGFVGTVESVNVGFLRKLLELDIIPVISPIGCGKAEYGEEQVTYNINADIAAASLAGTIKAKQIIFLTDVGGVLNRNRELLTHLTLREAHALIRDKTITGGMIPKVHYAAEAILKGVEFAKIIDGRKEHALLHQIVSQVDSRLDGGTTIRY